MLIADFACRTWVMKEAMSLCAGWLWRSWALQLTELTLHRLTLPGEGALTDCINHVRGGTVDQEWVWWGYQREVRQWLFSCECWGQLLIGNECDSNRGISLRLAPRDQLWVPWQWIHSHDVMSVSEGVIAVIVSVVFSLEIQHGTRPFGPPNPCRLSPIH